MVDKEGLVKAKQAVWRFLARRDHGEEELARKLSRHGFAAAVITETIDYFRGLGYLNDKLFAVGQARRLAEDKGLGDRRLHSSLLQKGISASLAEEAITAIRQEWSEEQAVRSLIKKKTKNRPLREDPQGKQRLYRYLLGRGFPPGLIYEMINRAEEEDGHDDDGK